MTGLVGVGGVFDILHIGHIKLLEFAASLGEEVVVFLNSDKSVESIRGCSTTIPFKQRKIMLEAVRYVDQVIGFDEDSPAVVLQKLKPDIWVTGVSDSGAGKGDELKYMGEGGLTERDVVESYGGYVVLFHLIVQADWQGNAEKISSSTIEERIYRTWKKKLELT